jgi:hypothetical protein
VGIFGSFFGQKSLQTINQSAPFNGGPELVGGLLLYQFFRGNRPLVTDQELESLCRPFARSARNHVEIWLVTVSAWLLKLLAAARYGEDFGRKVMAAVYGRLAANEDRLPEAASLAQGIKYWFKELDDSVQDAMRNPIVIKGETLPISMHFALRFLARDTSSPFGQNTSNFDGADFDLAVAIAHVQEMIKPRADHILALLWQILFSVRVVTDLSLAIRASLSLRMKNEIDDGVAHGRQARLRRRSVDSFFSAPLVRGDAVARRRRRSWSSVRDDEDLARIAPQSDQARVLLSPADEPAHKSIVP